MKACYKPSLLLSLLITAFAFPAMSAIPPMSPGPGVVLTPTAIPSHLRYETPINLGSLGAIPGTPLSHAYDLNNSAQVVGVTTIPPVLIGSAWWSFTKGFLWNHGVMVTPPVNPGLTTGELKGINNSGIAVGQDGGNAFVYKNNTIQPLNHLSTANISFASNISDSGKIVGFSKASNGFFHAVTWDSNNNITDLGTLAGYSRSDALGISDSGRFIVGQASGTSPLKAIMWDQNNVLSILNGAPNNNHNKAWAVNDSGIAVGHMDVPSANIIVPVRWINGQVEKLNGDTMGNASGINNPGQIVGYYFPVMDESAFLWDNGKFYDLNALIPPNTGWVLTRGTSINDKGEIVGTGIINGEKRAFLIRLKQ